MLSEPIFRWGKSRAVQLVNTLPVFFLGLLFCCRTPHGMSSDGIGRLRGCDIRTFASVFFFFSFPSLPSSHFVVVLRFFAAQDIPPSNLPHTLSLCMLKYSLFERQIDSSPGPPCLLASSGSQLNTLTHIHEETISGPQGSDTPFLNSSIELSQHSWHYGRIGQVFPRLDPATTLWTYKSRL